MPVPGLFGMPRSSVNPAGPVVTIWPETITDNHFGTPNYAQHSFTLMSLIGAPASYAWSIVAGIGSFTSGQGTATITVRTNSTCVVQCAVDIGGVIYTPEASLFYEPGEIGSGSSGGGALPGSGGGGELQ